MFEHIIAIDLASRIPDFHRRVSAFSPRPVVSVSDADEVFKSGMVLSGVDGVLISIHQGLTEDNLKNFPHLRYIGVLGTSLKKLPLDYCRRRHIKVTNVTEYCDEDTAEWVILKALNFFRTKNPPRSGTFKTLGIIGAGAVGKHVIAFASAFHMKIVFNSSREQPELLARGAHSLSKEEVFHTSDVVSLHTPAFLSWLSKDILRKSRENLCIINTCMGRISVGNDLENVLNERPDISLIMDKIAGDHYPKLKGRAQILPEAAFLTLDAEQRLVDKFFTHLASG